jgi:hypothetical protein
MTNDQIIERLDYIAQVKLDLEHYHIMAGALSTYRIVAYIGETSTKIYEISLKELEGMNEPRLR